MPHFAANLTMLFTEMPFLQRFAAASQAGFDAVEFLFPYEFGVSRIADALCAHRLELVPHNLQAGNWSGGSAASPATRRGSPSSARAWRARSSVRRRCAVHG